MVPDASGWAVKVKFSFRMISNDHPDDIICLLRAFLVVQENKEKDDRNSPWAQPHSSHSDDLRRQVANCICTNAPAKHLS